MINTNNMKAQILKIEAKEKGEVFEALDFQAITESFYLIYNQFQERRKKERTHRAAASIPAWLHVAGGSRWSNLQSEREKDRRVIDNGISIEPFSR